MRTYDHNGETREISMDSLADSELAEVVGELQIGEGDTSVFIAARDRILCLAKEKQDLEDRVRLLEGVAEKAAARIVKSESERDDARRTILQCSNGDDFGWDVLGQVAALSSQRDELLGAIKEALSDLAGMGFVCLAESVLLKALAENGDKK